MRVPALVLLVVLLAAPALAQTPAPTPPAPQPTQPTTPPTTPPPPPPPPAPEQEVTHTSAWRDKVFFGGGVGASFGDIDYVEVMPMVGYRLTPRVSAGVSLFYRWKQDDRFQNYSVDTNDVGGSVFGRVNLIRNVFGVVEFEYGEYEYVTLNGTTVGTESYSDENVFAGLGISSCRGRAGLYFTALYNFSYDDNDPFEPYDSPWVYRVGVSVGF